MSDELQQNVVQDYLQRTQIVELLEEALNTAVDRRIPHPEAFLADYLLRHQKVAGMGVVLREVRLLPSGYLTVQVEYLQTLRSFEFAAPPELLKLHPAEQEPVSLFEDLVGTDVSQSAAVVYGAVKAACLDCAPQVYQLLLDICSRMLRLNQLDTVLRAANRARQLYRIPRLLFELVNFGGHYFGFVLRPQATAAQTQGALANVLKLFADNGIAAFAQPSQLDHVDTENFKMLPTVSQLESAYKMKTLAEYLEVQDPIELRKKELASPVADSRPPQDLRSSKQPGKAQKDAKQERKEKAVEPITEAQAICFIADYFRGFLSGANVASDAQLYVNVDLPKLLANYTLSEGPKPGEQGADNAKFETDVFNIFLHAGADSMFMLSGADRVPEIRNPRQDEQAQKKKAQKPAKPTKQSQITDEPRVFELSRRDVVAQLAAALEHQKELREEQTSVILNLDQGAAQDQQVLAEFRAQIPVQCLRFVREPASASAFGIKDPDQFYTRLAEIAADETPRQPTVVSFAQTKTAQLSRPQSRQHTPEKKKRAAGGKKQEADEQPAERLISRAGATFLEDVAILNVQDAQELKDLVWGYAGVIADKRATIGGQDGEQ